MKQPVEILAEENTYQLHIMWSLHNKCNYKCSYCSDEINGGDLTNLNLAALTAFVDKVENHYKERIVDPHKVLFSFTGGEPTLWKDFFPFLNYIADKGYRAGITTNASVGLNFWERASSFFDYICLSFHPEAANVDEFLNTFEFLHNKEKTVVPSVRVMMHPNDELWNKCVELVEKLKKFPNWTYECVHILEDYGGQAYKMDYKDPQKEKYLEENAFKFQFTDNSFVTLPEAGFHHKVRFDDGSIEKLDENKLINSEQVNFKGWECDIGLEHLFIHQSGKIKTSGCFNGTWIGSVFELDKLELPTGPDICKLNGCFCPTDIRISKRKLDCVE